MYQTLCHTTCLVHSCATAVDSSYSEVIECVSVFDVNTNLDCLDWERHVMVVTVFGKKKGDSPGATPASKMLFLYNNTSWWNISNIWSSPISVSVTSKTFSSVVASLNPLFQVATCFRNASSVGSGVLNPFFIAEDKYS